MEGDPVIPTLTRKPTRVSPWLQSVLAFMVVASFGAILPWASEKPPSKYFYPYIGLLAIGTAILSYRNPFPVVPQADRPIESQRTAMLRALRSGLPFGVIYFFLYYLGWDSSNEAWGQGFTIAVLATTSRYATGRKLPHPRRVVIITASVWLVAYAIVLLFLRRR